MTMESPKAPNPIRQSGHASPVRRSKLPPGAAPVPALSALDDRPHCVAATRLGSLVPWSIPNSWLNVNPGLINPKRLFNWEDTI